MSRYDRVMMKDEPPPSAGAVSSRAKCNQLVSHPFMNALLMLEAHDASAISLSFLQQCPHEPLPPQPPALARPPSGPSSFKAMGSERPSRNFSWSTKTLFGAMGSQRPSRNVSGSQLRTKASDNPPRLTERGTWAATRRFEELLRQVHGTATPRPNLSQNSTAERLPRCPSSELLSQDGSSPNRGGRLSNEFVARRDSDCLVGVQPRQSFD